MKYCPNCLGVCNISPYDKEGYGCDKCEVLLYATSVLLDIPDKEKSRKYKTKKILGKYNLGEEDIDYIINEIDNLSPLKRIMKSYK